MLIPVHDINLEAALWEPEAKPLRGAALLCHPHPLHGGTMNNRVIYRAAKGSMEAGFAALRFNFRGVGKSTGSYGHGIGERKDVEALLDWLSGRFPGLPLALVGFSFGAWVGLQAGCHDPRIRILVGLGVPLNNYDCEFLLDNVKPTRYIIGTNDEFCTREKMAALERRLPTTSTVGWVDGADHFFTHQIDRLQGLVREFLLTPLEGHPI